MEQTTQLSPAHIMQVGSGFWASKILLAAVDFNLFSHLAEKKQLTGKQIKTLLRLECSDRHVYDFLDALFVLGFLRRDGLLEEAVYSNSPEADFFLDQDKPAYMGGILKMFNNRLYGFWGNLDEALKTGRPQNESRTGDAPIFEALYRNPELLTSFVNGMTGAQIGNFMALAEQFDFSPYKTFLDVGGSAGVLSALVARNHNHMRCQTFDLPPVEPIAKQTIQKFNLADRVRTISGDFFREEFPKADVVAMGNILHDWNEEEKVALMRKAFDALPEGGAFIAIEAVIDDERNKNLFGMMMSLNMLIETEGGFDYSYADFRKWAQMAGFGRTDIMPLAGPSSAVIAYK